MACQLVFGLRLDMTYNSKQILHRLIRKVANYRSNSPVDFCSRAALIFETDRLFR